MSHASAMLSDERIRELQNPDKNGPITVAMAREIEASRRELRALAAAHAKEATA